ncbi:MULTISPECIES: hypothetical protein [Bradyrhizobium]|uniref:hypothetical protein n=1 Tax=Bradyrhizobium TaxID=374 RepID=UPI0035126078
MSQQINARVAAVGIDIGKTSFLIIGQDLSLSPRSRSTAHTWEQALPIESSPSVAATPAAREQTPAGGFRRAT